MSQLPATAEQMTAKQAALAHMLTEHDERRDELTALFEARKAQREEISHFRKESEATKLGTIVVGERGYHPVAVSILSRLYSLQSRSPYLAALAYFQVQVGANALGLDKDIQAPPPDEQEGPVFDRTSTGRRQGGSKYGPRGAALMRKASENVVVTTISAKLLSEFLGLIAQGLPIQNPPGRPSNVFRATRDRALEIVERERRQAKEQGEDIGDQEAAERNAERLRQGISPLRLVDASKGNGSAAEINLEE